MCVRVADALVQRTAFPKPFLAICNADPLVQFELTQCADETRGRVYEDNKFFTAAMDEQVVQWFSACPADLVPASGGAKALPPLRLLLVALAEEEKIDCVRVQLGESGSLTVDTCDMRSQPLTLPLLQKYECVVLWTEAALSSEVRILIFERLAPLLIAG